MTKIFSCGQKWQTQNLQTSDGVKRLRLNFCHDAYDDCHNSLVDIRKTSHYFFYSKHLSFNWNHFDKKVSSRIRCPQLIWGMPGSLMHNPQKYGLQFDVFLKWPYLRIINFSFWKALFWYFLSEGNLSARVLWLLL